LLACRELDDALGLTDMVGDELVDRWRSRRCAIGGIDLIAELRAPPAPA